MTVTSCRKNLAHLHQVSLQQQKRPLAYLTINYNCENKALIKSTKYNPQPYINLYASPICDFFIFSSVFDIV